MSKYFSKYKDTPKYVTRLARNNRVQPTAQEENLWAMLSGKKLNGLKFRRQFPIDRYIADFYYHPGRLVIEIDGNVHNVTKKYDRNRESYLKARGYRIIRFSNHMVDTGIERVIQAILNAIKNPPSGESGGETEVTTFSKVSEDPQRKGQIP